jgi:GNAT superfamily N-acetyltransferase
MFKHHHYLSSEILQNAETFTAFWDESPIGFTSCVPFPHGHLRNAWREHRTVILPDYQGLGIGVRLSDWLGERCLSMGRKFYSRTSHPRMGEYRERSPLWTPNGNNRTANSMNESIKGGSISHGCNFTRVCFSHKYVGRSRTTAPQRKRS